MIGILRYWLILAIGTFLAAFLIPGINYGGNWAALVLVVMLLSLFNAVLKPLLILFTLPFIIVTLGLGLWVINAVLLYMAARLVGDFYVAGFGSALLGSLVISLTHFVANRLFDGKPRKPRRYRGRRDDVIDV
jgi:putative membrane protein